MHETEPEVFLIAHTSLDDDGVMAYLASLGVDPNEWSPDVDNNSDMELLTEISSRSCYMSYGTGLNKNIARVREGNEPHIKNILASGHGSVLEHASATFAFRNISRVFTHEVVRHRAGWAWSQESLRYVRADELGYWIPEILQDSKTANYIIKEHFGAAETRYKLLLEEAARIEGKPATLEGFESLSMDLKKKHTSAIRRVLPIGMATNIIGTANIRALRHVIEMRTHKSAEEEVRLVFRKVAEICLEKWPNLFQDMSLDSISGEYHFQNHKV